MPLQRLLPRSYKGQVRSWLSNKKKVNVIRALGMSQRLMWFIVAELCMADEDSDDVVTEVRANLARRSHVWRGASVFATW